MGRDLENLVNIADDLMKLRWPEALGGFAGGSLMRGAGGPLSDIDLVLLLPEQDRPRKYWLRHQGVPFDVFCHDESNFRHYVQNNWRERRPVLLGIVAEGVLLPRPNALLRKWQRYARNVLRKGLPPLQEEERLARRYQLMDCLEDYEDAANPVERKAIAAHLYLLLLDAVCLLGDKKQLGNGKWKGRLANQADAPLVAALNAAYEVDLVYPQRLELLALGDRILARLGGRLEAEACMMGAPENRKDRLRLFP